MMYLRLFLLLILLPFNLYAGSKIEKIESCLQDISKRYVLATHGVAALQFYDIGCADYEDLEEYNDKELEPFTAPLNPNTTSLLDFIILSLNFVGIGYFCFLLLNRITQGIDNTQSTGVILGKASNTAFTLIKICGVIALLVPIYSPYNYAQMLVFKVAGYSNHFTKEIVTSMVSNQPHTFPSLKLPNSDSKQLDMAKLIQFMTCVKAEPTVKANSIELNFYRENGLVKASSSYGKCYLDIQIGLDKYTTEIIEESKSIKELLGNNVDFNKVQFAIQQKLFKELLEQADKASDILIKPVDIIRSESNEFDNLVVNKATNATQVIHWESTCNNIINYVPSQDLTRTEKEQYLYLSSRCLSHTATQRLVYPYDNPEITKYFKTANYLESNTLELCAHDYSVARTVKTVISETSSEIEIEDIPYTFSIKRKSAKQCLLEACSNLNSDNSNAYICANAVHLYDTLEKNKTMSERGFITLGAYIYTMFTGLSTSESAKSIYNNFKINFLNQGNHIGAPNSEDVLFTVTQSFKPITHDKMLAYLYTEMPSVDILNHRSDFNAIEGKYGDLVSTSKGVDFLGSGRFVECMNKPMRVSNGYACSSTAQEIHSFGKNILQWSFFVKTMIATINTSKALRKPFKKEKEKSTNGILDNVRTSLKSSALPFAMDGSSLLLVNVLFGGEQIATDEFGSFDSSKKHDQLLHLENVTGNGIALLSLANKGSFLSSAIDTLINFLIILGIVMAYSLPLLPLMLWLLALLGWFTMFISMIIVMPLWTPRLIKVGQNYFNDFEKRGLAMATAMVLKLPLLCIGLLISWFLTNLIVSELVQVFSISSALSSEYGFSLTAYIDVLIALIVYCALYVVIISQCISIIEVFAVKAIGYLEGDINLKQDGQDRTQGLISNVGSGIKAIANK
jgi:hypothetical protein